MAVSFLLVLLIRSSDRLFSLAPLALGGVIRPRRKQSNPTSSNTSDWGTLLYPLLR